MGNPILYIVIPCYNEEAVLPLTSGMFLKKIKDLAAAGKISDKSRILFVNDGSKDKTWDITEAWLKRTSITGASAFPVTAAIRTLCWRA